MDNNALREFLQKKYENPEAFLENVIFPVFGEDNYETSLSEAGLANVKLRQGKFQEALALHMRYLKNYVNAIGTEAPYYAVILSGIGDDYYQMEDYDSALDYHLKALSDISQKVGKTPSGFYNSVGNDLYCLDRYSEAITYYETGLKLAKERDDEWSVSVFHNCIGNAYGFLGRFEMALAHFESALCIRRKILPAGDNRITTCENNVRKAKEMITRPHQNSKDRE